MELELEIDHLGREIPVKPFNLVVPLRTRLHFLKKSKTLQEENLQDECSHANFENRVCDECGLKCEHWESEEGYCLDCGEYQEPWFDEDMAFERAREARYGL